VTRIKCVESTHYLPLDMFKANKKNPKIHTPEQLEHIKKSIIRFGFNDPIATWGDKFLIVEGHGRIQALKELVASGEYELPKEGVPYIPLDELTPAERDAYMLEHNQATMETDWDAELLADVLGDLSENGLDMSEFGFGLGDDEEDDPLLDDKYNNIAKGEIIYEPKETHHKVSDLFQMTTEFDEEIAQIENEEMRELLRLRAAWFAKFNFAKIADYYAYQASPEEQRIFERLALVLLDENRLYENGFANIMKQIDDEDSDE